MSGKTLDEAWTWVHTMWPTSGEMRHTPPAGPYRVGKREGSSFVVMGEGGSWDEAIKLAVKNIKAVTSIRTED